MCHPVRRRPVLSQHCLTHFSLMNSTYPHRVWRMHGQANSCELFQCRALIEDVTALLCKPGPCCGCGNMRRMVMAASEMTCRCCPFKVCLVMIHDLQMDGEILPGSVPESVGKGFQDRGFSCCSDACAGCVTGNPRHASLAGLALVAGPAAIWAG